VERTRDEALAGRSGAQGAGGGTVRPEEVKERLNTIRISLGRNRELHAVRIESFMRGG
jgi:hypothetical protein